MMEKLRPSDYEGFDSLPKDQQQKILRAVAKRLRRKARKEEKANG